MNSDELPRIWYSRILTENASFDLSVRTDGPFNFDEYAAYGKWYREYRPYDDFDGTFVPECLIPSKSGVRINSSEADAFRVSDAILIVSSRLRDILSAFDLGKTRLLPVALMQSRGVPTDGPPFFVLHIAEAKPTLIPEASENLRQVTPWGSDTPRPGAPWAPFEIPDKLGVKAEAAEGVDLWHDPQLQDRIFFSDRLRQAIEAAHLSAKSLKLQEAKVITYS